MHTWLDTQSEGWWRMAFDKLYVPFAYIITQTVSREADLGAKYDVIVFAKEMKVAVILCEANDPQVRSVGN